MEEPRIKLEKPKEIKQITPYIWEIPKTHKSGMNVPARIVASKKLVDEMDPGVYDQITNVANLPGIQKFAYCMPDGHWGYGFPIGGVAAFDLEEGVISPGGIGFDISCGMRLVRTNLTIKELEPKMKELVDALYKKVPAGVGSSGFVKLTAQQFKDVVDRGAEWCLEQGYAWEDDLKHTESNGRWKEADVSKISDKSVQRGKDQIGTLGSGNHYLEVQEVKEENIFDKDIAKNLGIFPGQAVIMFHCGSRGFGHQVATDYLTKFLSVMESKYKIKILDRELACAPFQSPEGQDYFKAMQCGANMSLANRQVILHRIREVFSDIFKQSAESLGIKQIWDVSHNLAKIEEHTVDGKKKKVIVHRKGSTASYNPGRSEIPEMHKDIGSVVIIGGSMETGSYLLVGGDKAEETFCSTAHGSGRTMSRNAAKRMFRGDQLQKDMEKRGILVKTVSFSGLAEEAGPAYKDVHSVCETIDKAGLSKRVVSLVPRLNVKG